MPIRSLVIVVAALTACTYEPVDLTGLDGCSDDQGSCGDFGLGDDDTAGDVSGSDGEPIGGDAMSTGDSDGGDGDSAPADSDDPCAQAACTACESNYVRPAGIAGNCCPDCERVDFGCTSPPRRCSADSDCAGADTCYQGFCGRYDADSNTLTIDNGSQCTPSACWSNFDHYRGDCCPSCTVMCGGTDACAPEDCVGSSCDCNPSKTACTEQVCECSI